MQRTPEPKRQLLLAGLITLTVILLTFVSVTVAMSRDASPSQYETEPNDDFDDASTVYVPGHIMGSAWNSVTDTDYFVMETTIGEEYQARVTILSSDGLALRMVLYDGDRNFVAASSFAPGHTDLSWATYTTTYYIQVAAAILTETIQTAEYCLDIDWVAPTPTMTPSPTATATSTPPPPTFTPIPWPPEIIRVATTGSDVLACGSAAAPCCTVQYAVDTARPGDEIRVAAGVYTGVQARAGITQVVYISKTITLRGGYTTTDWDAADPEANPTTLDAQGLGRVLVITGSIDTTLEGLRITGGDATGLGGYPLGHEGGGVYVSQALTTISGCVVYSNTASTDGWGLGGGLYLNSSYATLQNNTIISNTASTATQGRGGGLYLQDGNATLKNNTLRGNIASTAFSGAGGGLYLWNNAATLQGNTVQGNTASTANLPGCLGAGGGLRLEYSDATLQDNTIISNTASTADVGYGGGLYLYYSDATLQDNTVVGNTASTADYGQGGGLYLYYSDATLQSNTVVGNIASTADWGYGGGLYLSHSDSTLAGNTIANNTATLNSTVTGWGGGLYVHRSNIFTMTNNLVAGNHANTTGTGYGSGLWVEGSDLHPVSGYLLHTTIADNTDGGQGVYVGDHTTLAFTNTIIAGHASVGITVTAGSTATLEGTLWHNNGVDAAGAGTILTGTVNVHADPAFVDPAAWDYHLSAGSLAIDAGVGAGTPVDIDGDPRFWPHDIGADEFVRRLYLPVMRRNP